MFQTSLRLRFQQNQPSYRAQFYHAKVRCPGSGQGGRLRLRDQCSLERRIMIAMPSHVLPPHPTSAAPVASRRLGGPSAGRGGQIHRKRRGAFPRNPLDGGGWVAANAHLGTGPDAADGYLWAGTWFGLARFDGVRFVVFNSANTPEFKESPSPRWRWIVATARSGLERRRACCG